MKRLVIVCLGSNTGYEIKSQINKIIGDKVTINVVLISELTKADIKCDLVIFTSEYVAELGLKYIKENISYLIAKRVINHKNIEKLISLKNGTEVLLVNDGEISALEAIEQLRSIGLDHVKYFPYYPGCSEYPRLEIAVTPGEVLHIPKFIRTTINIGSRILDIKTIYEIISKLKIKDVLGQSLVTEYIKDIVEISRAIESNRRSVIESQKLLETILNSVESGIAYTDKDGRIISVNLKFESIFGKKRKDLLNKKITFFLNSIDIFSDENKSIILEVSGKEVLIDINLVNYEEKCGYLITVNYTDKISKLDHKIRRNYERKLTKKLHTFKDYLTINKSVKEMIKRAERFSKTDSTILIQGENGTGKEILAQAIHMNSYRRRNVFIPINITAIAPSLLESELFGYEEGAFTGAKKGGKPGIFEIASGGTVFIDEIGDAPLNFQVKLLRVLEEKRIRRVGALDEIPIDVRIIAATNKNLLKLINEGKFREDLFFRLNILPLKTIPLRNRKEDIRYLLIHFANISFGSGKINSLKDILEDETIEFLENYRWRGNVRELINLVEYLSFVYENKKISLSSLPYYMLENEIDTQNITLDENELWVLKEIEKNGDFGIGRNSLSRISKKHGIDLGEGKIRSIIKKMKERGLIIQKNGKRGCVITQKGIWTLEFYK
ncbi:PAS domain S-box-containing protein [Caminicella sporogenes DSM 14501]|uniref:PAS domain S-box-containing protein n=1 Tax=Caminicella sporogenes DSM 14501 TaxID=1121266 RepID=A0A1M6NX04_9FIRM|nr:sigma 54-interacting transcriptional regulator [Caminicella sporogenes]RKD21616.1 hypothetical protein BET04_07810 [Caminicella sporogenes]SHK00180.1 PAS domain S-box-containing protein [Caminicella sporogenes DSM 14501]